jgi:glucose/arabinose dehydrogenase
MTHQLGANRALRAVLAVVAASCAALAGASGAVAQRAIEMNGNGDFQAPVAPSLAVPPLPATPVDIVTAEQDIRVSVVASGLAQPWSMAFPSDDVILVAERGGAIRVIRDGVLAAEPVGGGPDVTAQGLSGFDLALHPDFAENGWIYFTYPRAVGEDQRAVTLGRARWDGATFNDYEILFTADPGQSGGSRIAFGRDGTVFMSMSGNDPQDPTTLGGKVLRLTAEGGVPDDNPFVGLEGYRPEIYTMGHRVIIGLAVHPETGEAWATENGPNGGDEMNRLVPGGNYGWPLVSLGRDYEGAWHSERFQGEGMIDPVVYWTPSIAVSGLLFYRGAALPGWTNDVFVGAMRAGEISGTGHFQRIVFNLEMHEMRRETLLWDWRRRIRDIRQGPDGNVYLLTDGDDAAVLRVAAAE